MVIRPLTFAERRSGLTVPMLLQRIDEWNWTDWDGEPLPLPHDDDSPEQLTDAELEFILAQFGVILPGMEGNAKN